MKMFKIRFIFRRYFSNISGNIKYNLKSDEILRDKKLKYRINPIILKLDTPEFHNIITEEVNKLKYLFDKHKHEIRIVGGVVRDLLLGYPVEDIDFATTATPKQMKNMFNAESVRIINESSEKHGTITIRLNDKKNFEITTLRTDKVIDGRRVGFEFHGDWKLDALRRDFTINSMYLGFDGCVYDYVNGYDDLQKKKIVFVDDPDLRIQEDPLRILRYFRFYGRFSEDPNNHDEKTLAVIKNNVKGLETVHGARVWMELKKILHGRFAGSLMEVMLEIGILEHIGISNPNKKEFFKLLERTRNVSLHPMSYLAALMYDVHCIGELHERLMFSNYDFKMLNCIVTMRDADTKSLVPYQKLILNSNMTRTDAMEYVRETLKYNGDKTLFDQFNEWQIPRFPVNIKDLYITNKKKIFKEVVRKLKDIWIENEFKPTSEDLVKLIPTILEECNKSEK